MDIPKFTIKTQKDIESFFHWLLENDILLHPDDSFTWVVDFAEDEGEEPPFTRKQGEYLDQVMDDCFSVCEDLDLDIYGICMFCL